MPITSTGGKAQACALRPPRVLPHKALMRQITGMTSVPQVALATAVHDPSGKLVPAIVRLAPRLNSVFSEFAFNISEATSPGVAEVAVALLGATIVSHPPSEAHIGRIRREAVALVRRSEMVLYSDPDHLLRWIDRDEADLRRVLAAQPDVDFLVVGRSAEAMAQQPARLRETERLVNHTYQLLTGDEWDLLFAVRRLSRPAAALIATESRVETLANDVEWPLLARQAGLRLGYAQSDSLIYRTIEEFGAPADTGDGQPLQWIRRLEFAALMATAMRPFLPKGP